MFETRADRPEIWPADAFSRPVLAEVRVQVWSANNGIIVVIRRSSFSTKAADDVGVYNGWKAYCPYVYRSDKDHRVSKRANGTSVCEIDIACKAAFEALDNDWLMVTL